MSQITYRKATDREKYVAIADGRAIIVEVNAANEYTSGVTTDPVTIRVYNDSIVYQPCTKEAFYDALGHVMQNCEETVCFFEELTD